MTITQFPVIAVVLIVSSFGFPFSFGGVTMDADGWTVVTPSADSRLVYVSSSEGDNSNDGLSPDRPKRTLSAGAGLIRDGYPDHLLLKRGDVFEPEDGTRLGRWKSGRNVEEPVVVSYYGEDGDRPILKVTHTFVDHDGDTRNYQAFIGLDIYKSNSDPDSADFDNSSCSPTLRFVGGGDYLRVEDCRLRFGMMNIESLGGHVYHYPVIRRNIITDTWAHGSYLDHDGRIQGIYMSGVRGGYTIDENFFDHNGWSEVIQNAGPNMYNHNIYIQYSNVQGGLIRGNIIARGAANGLQARSGGIVENNLFVLNAISLLITGPGVARDSGGSFPNRATQNVVLNGRLMDPANSSYPRSSAVWGIDADHGPLINDNIVANRRDSGQNFAFNHGDNGMFTLVDNIVYNWQSTYDRFDSSWAHPDADMGDYYASIGGINDTIAYLNWLRERPLGEWPWEMTAYSGINYIRSGFRSNSANYLEGWPATRHLMSSGGSTSFRIESNLNWSVESTADWLTVETSSGSGVDTFEVNVDPNLSAGQRSAVVLIESGSLTRELNVWQDGQIPYFSAQPSSIAVNGAEGFTTFTISSTNSWTVSPVSSWLEVEPTSGTGSGTVSVFAEDNPGSTLRIGQIQVTGSDGLGERTLQVYQTKETWAGFDLENSAKDVNTGEEMFGWVNVATRPWVWFDSVRSFIYLEEPWMEDHGFWAYVSDVGTEKDFNWVVSEEAHYYYSYSLKKWAYSESDLLNETAYWVWILL